MTSISSQRSKLKQALSVVAHDGVVKWSSMYATVEDGGVTGHPTASPFVEFPEKSPFELFWFAGSHSELFDTSDDSLARSFLVDDLRFSTSNDGQLVWVYPDLAVWSVWSELGADPLCQFLSPVNELLRPEAWETLKATLVENPQAQFRHSEAWSSTLIDKALHGWALAFADTDAAFIYEPEPVQIPDFYQQALESLHDLEASPDTLIAACQGADPLPDTLPFQEPQSCFLNAVAWRNPDGLLVCGKHKVSGAVPWTFADGFSTSDSPAESSDDLAEGDLTGK